MPEMQKPNVANDLIRIHKIITRGLEVAMEQGRSFAQNGYPDQATRDGFVCYVQALASMTHGHHLTEDEVAHPYFRDKLLEMPYDVLTSEHQAMVPILEEIQAAIERVASEAESGDALGVLNRALARLADLWYPHFQKEEKHFTPEKVGALIDVDEQIRLAQQFAQHSQQHAGPDYLVVPFMLYNLEPADRAALSKAMPPVVTEQLVPVVWKEKWAAMKPFLLD